MDRNNFNAIARFYDPLARAVFGKVLDKAQACFLDSIPKGSTVLVVGGGSGWILSGLDKLRRPLHVTYLEASSVMIRKASQRQSYHHLTIDFVEGREDAIADYSLFDVVITNFLLDLFREPHLVLLMRRLSGHLKPHGLWLCTDFVPTGKWWQKALMKLMYWFFGLTAGVEGRRLLDFHIFFEKIGFRLERAQCFYSGMIKSSIYKNSGVN